MCGILIAPSSFRPEALDRALDSMGYRGDGEPGHKASADFAGWTLGHVRLAIQDRSEQANQPYVGKLGVYAFVGEFFNHGCDTEMDFVLEAMADLTKFHQVDGFWAAASITGQGVSVYTDHLGIKPMYFWPALGIICSEIEPMFVLAGMRPTYDRVYLSNCIKWGYDYSGRTPYEGIIQLAPGTRLQIDSSGVFTQKRYWNWYMVPRPWTVREAVTEAIENRLIGERPVAMLLSGGLDSSIIYYTLQRLGREIEVFSVENGESEFLPEGVTTLNLPYVSVEEALSYMQAPLDLGSMVPQVQLARAVSAAGYSVCMTGDGADEVFGGYRRAKEYDSQHSDVFCELPYYHLPRLDQVMMRETIELRSPYLSPSVVAFGLAFPWNMRQAKDALKHAFTGVVPDKILERPKHSLKTQAVIEGGTEYRHQLVQTFMKQRKGI